MNNLNMKLATKIFSVEQIRNLDKYTIETEPISSIDLMERASIAFVKWFTAHFDSEHPVHIFIGLGNNGGDGLAIARLLSEEGYYVETKIIRHSPNSSLDFLENYKRLPKKVLVKEILSIEDLKKDSSKMVDPHLSEETILIDALLGSGLTRKPQGLLADVIQFINDSNLKTISVDIASGLFADKRTEHEVVVKPDYTITFQLPKLGFLLPENEEFVGEWYFVDIGLSLEFIEKEVTDYYFVSKSLVKSIYKKKKKYSHKGNNGRALLVVGSFGKIGAGLLSAKACLRSGVGLLTVQVPLCGVDILHNSVPEAMVLSGKSKHTIEPLDWKKILPDVIGIGPGIGKDKKVLKTLKSILKDFKKPMVIDADAINLISENLELLKLVPANSILTPHIKEFERLVGESKNDFHRLEQLKEFSKKNKIYTILKGRHTAISTPEGKIYFNATGNPGMATGGSGDVLTGILTSLLAQNYSPIEASLLGVYLHGLTGDIAVKEVGIESFIPSDFFDFIGKSFLTLN